MPDNKQSWIVIPALIALVLPLGIWGCGAKGESTAAVVVGEQNETSQAIKHEVPQPFNAWGQISGDDVEFHWIDGTSGDFNRDGVTNGLDLFPLAARFGKPTDYGAESVQEQLYDNCIDGNRDGLIDGLDLFILATHFLERVDGYRIHVNQGNDEYQEITSERIARPGGYELCLPEFEWTAEEEALNHGLREFRIVAESDDATPETEAGSQVLLRVPEPGSVSGTQVDGWWPCQGRDHRKSYRSAYTGPRSYDSARVTTHKFREPLVSWTADAGGGLYVGYSQGVQPRVIFEYSAALRDIDEWEVTQSETGADFWGGYRGFLLSTQRVVFLEYAETGDEEYSSWINIYSSTGDQVAHVLLEERDREQNLSSLWFGPTPSGNIFLYLKSDLQSPEMNRFILLNADGGELWRIENVSGEITTNNPPLFVGYDGSLFTCTGEGIISINEASGGASLLYPLLDGLPADNWFEVGLSLGRDETLFFSCNYRDSHDRMIGEYGAVDLEGNEIARLGPIEEEIKYLIPLDDGTCYMGTRANRFTLGYLYRLESDSLDSIWREVQETWPSLLVIDAENYIYVAQSNDYACWSPDGEVNHTGPLSFIDACISPSHELIAFDSSMSIVAGMGVFYNK